MAMGKTHSDLIITQFQARARGYLLRNEVRRAREDFEEIVKEIDGGLAHLEWLEKAFIIPHFTDTQGTPPRPGGSFQNSNQDWTELSETSAAPELNREANRGNVSERLEAERDVPKTTESESGEKVNRESVGKEDVLVREKDRELMGSACESSAVWSSVESVTGLRQSHSVKDVARTPEALRVHRNTLSMELVWLQQAIDSRKKYLSLKNGLSAS